jgi:hypothetical protein
MNEMTTKPTDNTVMRPIGRDTIRSRLVLEVASEMVDQADWPNRQARVSLRPQGGDQWTVNMIASDGPAALEQVARGETHLAISNPAMYLALALRGTGPYKKPIALRAITIIPSPDQLAFAVTEKTGVKYPYAKYAQTTVRDFGGGMENISATTQTDNMIHDARAELDNTSDSLESHELAHQWFGDYVTCRNWSDIWLNESFATYFQAMWDEHHLGHDDFLYSDVKSNQEQYYSAWARGTTRTVTRTTGMGRQCRGRTSTRKPTCSCCATRASRSTGQSSRRCPASVTRS